MKNNPISQAAADLFPGYFAIVMATGIISIATFLLGMGWLAWRCWLLAWSLTRPSGFC